MKKTSEQATHPLQNIRDIQARAREHIERGALTPSYAGDVQVAIQLLNEVLATETVCALRYRQNYVVAEGLNARPIAQEFLEHAQEEQDHADQVAVRIRQLGGTPNLDPAQLLARSHSQYSESEDLMVMIKENLIAERIAIESYRELIRHFGDDDPTSRRLLEGILAKEEEHADELATLMHNEHLRLSA